MTPRSAIVLTVVAACVAPLAWAQPGEPQDQPLVSWPAPPYWLPSRAKLAADIEAGAVAEGAAGPSVERALPLVAIAPCRLLDSRAAGLPVLLPGVAQEIPVVGRCGIPEQAQGVSVRLVGGEGSGCGVVSLGAAGDKWTDGGRLVLDRGQASSTTGVVGLDGSGRLVAVTEGCSRHLIVEVNGYYAAEPSVRSLNALAGDVVLRAGENVAISAEGSTVTIAVAPGDNLGADRAGEKKQPVVTPLTVGRGFIVVLPRQPVKSLPPEQAMVPPPSSMYVGGALELPNTTAVGAGVITLGGNPFLHNYGPGVSGNTFVGQQAGNFTNTGTLNTGSGYNSLKANSSGYQNTAHGSASLQSNTEGWDNTAVGSQSLANNSTGDYNTAIGLQAGDSNTTGLANTFIGASSDATANNLTNATALGGGAVVDASNKVRIGNTSVTSIGGEVGWTAFSDERGKRDIQDLALGLDLILALRPVEYKLKHGNGRVDMGFVAQDIERLLGDGYNLLDIGGDADRTLALRYTDLIAPLVKAVQEQQAQIQSRDARIAALEARLAAIEARLAGK